VNGPPPPKGGGEGEGGEEDEEERKTYTLAGGEEAALEALDAAAADAVVDLATRWTKKKQQQQQQQQQAEGGGGGAKSVAGRGSTVACCPRSLRLARRRRSDRGRGLRSNPWDILIGQPIGPITLYHCASKVVRRPVQSTRQIYRLMPLNLYYHNPCISCTGQSSLRINLSPRLQAACEEAKQQQQKQAHQCVLATPGRVGEVVVWAIEATWRRRCHHLSRKNTCA